MIDGMKKEVTILQSLAKQYEQVGDMAVDLKILVDPNVNWNMTPNLSEISNDEFDLEMVIAHELVHVLGFGSFLELIDDRGNNYLTTSFIQSKRSGKQRLLPLSSFDRLIHSNDGSFADFGNVFEKTISETKSFEDFEAELAQNSEFMSAISKLYFIAIRNDVYLKFPDGSTANVQTGKVFVQGTTLGHFSDRYITTQDFLMSSFIEQGETLNSMMLKNNSTSILGPETFKVLRAIGWDVGDGPSPVKFVDILPESYFDLDDTW